MEYNFFLLFSLETELTYDHTFKSTKNAAVTNRKILYRSPSLLETTWQLLRQFYHLGTNRTWWPPGCGRREDRSDQSTMLDQFCTK